MKDTMYRFRFVFMIMILLVIGIVSFKPQVVSAKSYATEKDIPKTMDDSDIKRWFGRDITNTSKWIPQKTNDPVPLTGEAFDRSARQYYLFFGQVNDSMVYTNNDFLPNYGMRKGIGYTPTEQTRLSLMPNIIGVKRGSDPKKHVIGITAPYNTAIPYGDGFDSSNFDILDMNKVQKEWSPFGNDKKTRYAQYLLREFKNPNNNEILGYGYMGRRAFLADGESDLMPVEVHGYVVDASKGRVRWDIRFYNDAGTTTFAANYGLHVDMGGAHQFSKLYSFGSEGLYISEVEKLEAEKPGNVIDGVASAIYVYLNQYPVVNGDTPNEPKAFKVGTIANSGNSLFNQWDSDKIWDSHWYSQPYDGPESLPFEEISPTGKWDTPLEKGMMYYDPIFTKDPLKHPMFMVRWDPVTLGQNQVGKLSLDMSFKEPGVLQAEVKKTYKNLSSKKGNYWGDTLEFSLMARNTSPIYENPITLEKECPDWKQVIISDKIPMGLEVDINSIRLIDDKGTEQKLPPSSYDSSTRTITSEKIEKIPGQDKQYTLVFNAKVLEGAPASITNEMTTKDSRGVELNHKIDIPILQQLNPTAKHLVADKVSKTMFEGDQQPDNATLKEWFKQKISVADSTGKVYGTLAENQYNVEFDDKWDSTKGTRNFRVKIIPTSDGVQAYPGISEISATVSIEFLPIYHLKTVTIAKDMTVGDKAPDWKDLFKDQVPICDSSNKEIGEKLSIDQFDITLDNPKWDSSKEGMVTYHLTVKPNDKVKEKYPKISDVEVKANITYKYKYYTKNTVIEKTMMEGDKNPSPEEWKAWFNKKISVYNNLNNKVEDLTSDMFDLTLKTKWDSSIGQRSFYFDVNLSDQIKKKYDIKSVEKLEAKITFEKEINVGLIQTDQYGKRIGAVTYILQSKQSDGTWKKFEPKNYSGDLTFTTDPSDGMIHLPLDLVKILKEKGGEANTQAFRFRQISAQQDASLYIKVPALTGGYDKDVETSDGKSLKGFVSDPMKITKDDTKDYIPRLYSRVDLPNDLLEVIADKSRPANAVTNPDEPGSYWGSNGKTYHRNGTEDYFIPSWYVFGGIDKFPQGAVPLNIQVRKGNGWTNFQPLSEKENNGINEWSFNNVTSSETYTFNDPNNPNNLGDLKYYSSATTTSYSTEAFTEFDGSSSKNNADATIVYGQNIKVKRGNSYQFKIKYQAPGRTSIGSKIKFSLAFYPANHVNGEPLVKPSNADDPSNNSWASLESEELTVPEDADYDEVTAAIQITYPGLNTLKNLGITDKYITREENTALANCWSSVNFFRIKESRKAGDLSVQHIKEDDGTIETENFTNHKVGDPWNVKMRKYPGYELTKVLVDGKEIDIGNVPTAGVKGKYKEAPTKVQFYYAKTGALQLVSAPEEIDFGAVKYQGKTTRINSAKRAGDLIVKDTRSSKEGWSLTAKLTKQMTSVDNSKYTLNDALRYVYQKKEIILNTGAQEIMKQTASASQDEEVYNISDSWSSTGDGFKFEVSAQDVKELGIYQGEILWQLGPTP